MRCPKLVKKRHNSGLARLDTPVFLERERVKLFGLNEANFSGIWATEGFILLLRSQGTWKNMSCNGTEFPDDADQLIYAQTSWWLECVSEITIGILGILGNSFAILLLQSESLASNFNRLLICLSVFDNLFILSCLLEAIRRFVGTTNLHQLAFIYCFYQLQSIALSCSINTTVVLAIERWVKQQNNSHVDHLTEKKVKENDFILWPYK